MPLTDFKFRKSATITHQTGGLSNYQIKISVHRTSGIDSSNNVYLNYKCKADFSDIRFTNEYEIEIPYWIESIESETALIWINVDEINTSTIIYIYYSNNDAITTSDGYTTFDFFEDFSTDISNNWITDGNVSTSTNLCNIINTGYIISNESFQINKSLRFSANFKSINKSWIGFVNTTDSIYPYAKIEYNSVWFDNPSDGGASTYYVGAGTSTTSPSVFTNAYNVFEIKRNATNTRYYLNDTLFATHELYNAVNLKILAQVYTGTQTLSLKWLLVKQTATIEPTITSWSNELNLDIPLRISITPTSGEHSLSVTYNTTIKGTLNNFTLNYGDGNYYANDSATSFATTHTYNTPGTYTVWAEGYNEFASHVFYQIPDAINVNSSPVNASFTIEQTANHITFTDTSSGNVNEWYWDFGDNTFSHKQNPSHLYYSAGNYTITLHASNQYQYDTFATTVTITQILTPPEVYFTPNNLNVISPALPYTVNFTNLSTPAFGCTYNWLIDGTTYTTENPSHSFATYGMYDVGLTVTNALGSATKTYNDAIRITRKGKTFYEVINYADTPATFHVEVFNEVATSADTIIQAHIFDESINFVQDEVPDEPGLDEWGMRHFYSSINEWGHRIISAVTDWGNRILYNGSTLDNSPVTLFKAQEFREDVVFEDSWQFGTT